MQPVGFVSMVISAASPTTVTPAPLSWGVVFLVLFVMVVVGRIQEVIPTLAPLRIGLITGALAGLAWLFAPGSLEDKIPLRIRQVQYVLILVGLAVVTIPVGVWPGYSFEFLTDKYWKIVLLFLLVLFWCRTLQDIRRLIWACCVGAIVLVLSSLLSGQMGDERFHADSKSYDPNDLALLLVMMLPFLLYLFSTSGHILRVLLAGMTSLYLYSIVLTQSRGGFLALLVVGSLILWCRGLSRSAKVIVATIALLVFGGLAGSGYWDRIGTIWNPETEYDQTAGGRTEVWKTGIQILAMRPWGVGIAAFETAEGLSHGGTGKWSAAHNSFLQVGVELGIAGLIVFVLLLARTIKELRELQRNGTASNPQSADPTVLPQLCKTAWEREHGTDGSGDSLASLAAALEVSLWGFMVGGLFLSTAYGGMLYILLGLSIACGRLALPSSSVATVGDQNGQP